MVAESRLSNGATFRDRWQHIQRSKSYWTGRGCWENQVGSFQKVESVPQAYLTGQKEEAEDKQEVSGAGARWCNGIGGSSAGLIIYEGSHAKLRWSMHQRCGPCFLRNLGNLGKKCLRTCASFSRTCASITSFPRRDLAAERVPGAWSRRKWTSAWRRLDVPRMKRVRCSALYRGSTCMCILNVHPR